MPQPVVDAHCHLVNTRDLRYPWIEQQNPVLVNLLANYYDIAHDYGVEDYRRDVGDRVGAAVACEFGAADGVAEAEWVQRCHDTTGTPDAFIAALDLTASDVGERLARYADLPVVTAVRQPLYWAADPLRRLGARPDYLTDPQWRRGFERVAASGLTWDLLVYDEQLPAATAFVSEFPETSVVLEAAGWPLDLGPDGHRRWEDRIRATSELPNVTLKLQGIALLFGPSAEAVAPWVGTALDVFGPDRCLVASHFPVDTLLWTVDDLLAAVRSALGDRDGSGLFGGCARQQYLRG